MQKELTILIAEDDSGHASLVKQALRRAGINNPVIRFPDGRETLDFLLQQGRGPHITYDRAYLLLLDTRMPRVDGVEVLKTIKQHQYLDRLPVIVMTSTDNPREIEAFQDLGCSVYITKPATEQQLIGAIRKLNLLLMVVDIAHENSAASDTDGTISNANPISLTRGSHCRS